MSTEENKELVRQYFEGLNQENLVLLDEICDPDCVHRAGWSQGLSLDDFKKTATALFTIFANTHYGIDEMLAEGDTVVVRWTYQAIHVGEYMGIAGTGKSLKTWGVNFFYVRNGKIQESWELWDRLGFQQQLSQASDGYPHSSV